MLKLGYMYLGCSALRRRRTMLLILAVVFGVIALVFGLLGFRGVAFMAASLARAFLAVFLVLFLLFLLLAVL